MGNYLCVQLSKGVVNEISYFIQVLFIWLLMDLAICLWNNSVFTNSIAL